LRGAWPLDLINEAPPVLLRLFRMAETTLKITRSVLGSIISKATIVAVEEISLLMVIQNEIWYIFVSFISLS
jgi:hypothetical protein